VAFVPFFGDKRRKGTSRCRKILYSEQFSSFPLREGGFCPLPSRPSCQGTVHLPQGGRSFVITFQITFVPNAQFLPFKGRWPLSPFSGTKDGRVLLAAVKFYIPNSSAPSLVREGGLLSPSVPPLLPGDGPPSPRGKEFCYYVPNYIRAERSIPSL